MELRHLRYFIAVAETGSLTEAAERRLYTSQPSLSRQIRDLESQVGVELLSRSVRGVELTAAGKAFLDHARLVLMHVDAAVETARRAAQPARKTFAIGFQTGHEMNWLPPAMRVLHDELKDIQVTVSSDYSPDLAEALARGRLDLAFLRVEPGYDLEYHVVDREPLIVLMPSDHRLTARASVSPQDLVGEIFIGGSNKAAVLRAVTEDYLRRSGLDIKLDHGVDNMAMAMSLVASTRGLALMPAYAKNLLPPSVVSRPLEGEAPTIDIAVGYSKSNTSPVLELFLSRLDELRGAEPEALSRIKAWASRSRRPLLLSLPEPSMRGKRDESRPQPRGDLAYSRAGASQLVGREMKTIRDIEDFRALDPFFRIIEQGLEGLVDGGHFFDLLAEDVVFEFIITVPDYPRQVVGRDNLIELYEATAPPSSWTAATTCAYTDLTQPRQSCSNTPPKGKWSQPAGRTATDTSPSSHSSIARSPTGATISTPFA